MDEIALEIVLHSGAAGAPGWFEDAIVPLLRAAKGCRETVLFRAADGGAADPHIDDGAGWPRLAIALFRDVAEVEALQVSAAFSAALQQRDPAIELTANLWRRVICEGDAGPLPGPPRTAFSYVVRYRDEGPQFEAFRRDYLENHHFPLTRLPAIRSVMNFVPLPNPVSPLKSVPYLIGNEAVFDDLAAFNRAMSSPERHALRKAFLDGLKAPSAVHFAMERTIL